MWVVYIIATMGPTNVSGCLISWGASTGVEDGKSLNKHATTALKPGGGAIFGLGLGDPGGNVYPTSEWPAAVPWLVSAGPSSLHFGCCVTTLACQEWEESIPQGSPAGWGAAPPSNWGSCLLELHPILLSCPMKGEHLALQPTCWQRPSEWLVPSWAPL